MDMQSLVQLQLKLRRLDAIARESLEQISDYLKVIRCVGLQKK